MRFLGRDAVFDNDEWGVAGRGLSHDGPVQCPAGGLLRQAEKWTVSPRDPNTQLYNL